MIVEVHDSAGLFAFKLKSGGELVTNIPVTEDVVTVDTKVTKQRVEHITQLKEAGFSADEIIEMFKSGILQ